MVADRRAGRSGQAVHRADGEGEEGVSSIQVGKLYIAFGALAAPIQEQVSRCGLKLPSGASVILQKCADSITYLRIQGILPDGQVHKARQRLMKRIQSAINQGQNP